MKILNKIKDALTSTDFHVESTMKITDLCKNFKNNFGLSLRIYKGKILASDGRMTIHSLDQRTTNTSVNYGSGKLLIRANFIISEVEKLFLSRFGIVVKVADNENKKIMQTDLTLGDAKRLKV